MLWWTGASLFLWLALRELYHGVVAKPGFDQPHRIFKPYVAITLAIAVALAYTPMRYLFFERFLAEKAQALTGVSKASVHCNTFFDTAIDPMSLAAGHADWETGEIVFQKPWCGVLMDYLKHPERMEDGGVFSVFMFAHEAMHIRGEHDEAITECQAIQRYYRAARLLGIPDDDARKGSAHYYTVLYARRRQSSGDMAAKYYSDECAPGGKLDEKLEDSVWGN